MKQFDSDIQAQEAGPHAVPVWVGPPAIAYELGDIIPSDHQPAPSDPKTVMREAIKAERDHRRFDGGVIVGGQWFLSNLQATVEYSALITIATAIAVPDA